MRLGRKHSIQHNSGPYNRPTNYQSRRKFIPLLYLQHIYHLHESGALVNGYMLSFFKRESTAAVREQAEPTTDEDSSYETIRL